MNILFVSRLYPAYSGQPVNETSYALHAFVQAWVKGHQVKVIRPYYMPHNAKKFARIKTGLQIIDKVSVRVEHFWRIPKTNMVYYFSLFKLMNFFRFRKIAESLKSDKYDVVIGHMTDSFLLADELARRLRLPLVCGIHQNDTLEHLHSVFCRRKILSILNKSVGIACRSAALREALLAEYPQFAPKAFLVQSGIAEKNILPEQKYLTKAQSKSFYFVSACVMRDPTKNIHINLQALSKLKNIDWQYAIIGDGEDRLRLEKLTDELGLRDRVTFTGLLPPDKVQQYMQKADFYLLVSAPETFGLTYLEAMASGMIVVGAKKQGIDGVVINEQNGFLAEAGSVTELLLVIKKMVNLTAAQKKKILSEAYKTICNYTTRQKAEEYLHNLERYVKN